MSETLTENLMHEGVLEANELDRLLDGAFEPKTDAAHEAITNAVHSLAEVALENTAVISDDTISSINALISEIDRRLSEQVNHIIHHEDFRTIEGSWRGIEYLVSNTEVDEGLKIRVLNTSKKEVSQSFKKYSGISWDQNPLFKKLYEEEFGTAGGEPYGCLVGDYFFDHKAQDVAFLKGVSQIAAAAHAPFIAGSSPELLNMKSWQELSNPRDLTKIFQTAEYAPWRSFRDSENSKYVGLAMPRFLSRLPYSSKENPVDEFEFEEDITGSDHDKFIWTNSAYAMALNINQAFKHYGWCTQIRGVESGGIVEDLPCFTFGTDDGGVDMKCPTEIAITDRREAELAKAGLIPLVHWKNTDYAVFISAQSLNAPAEYRDPDATANANLAARLPYLFPVCRFAHFLKCIVRDKIGTFTSRDEMDVYLNNWISDYVTPDSNASADTKARFPLSSAQVEVVEDESNPGYYKAVFYLKPHYQLEGLTVSLRLVSKLPSEKDSNK